ncbi:hypothetical protein VST7929_01975 [Vibrio stylophorae]|uniref:C-type cytochrome biogenesis protein CcmI n=1 Tax=Vibrio stylophorae TaxID=659351 RepID=A0ABN8DZ49_9VIBR|nr:c-type cytochrome biogenesis protein CcmI [Vibrio stylophorae]CAH0534074.1 hypothetical protein VST7929_01975 [Vibrio stylophorae]
MSGLMFFFLTVLLLIAIVWGLRSAFRHQDIDNEQAARDHLNQALYHARKAELSDEAAQGLVQDEQAMQLELQHRLLADVPESANQSEQTQSHLSAWRLAPAVVLLVALCYGLYWQLGSYGEVRQWQQASLRLPELVQRQQETTWAPLTDAEQEQLILALRTELDKNPKDVDGWLTLGEVALNSRDLVTAIGATHKAYLLEPNSPLTQLAYAQSLLLSNDEASHQQARQLLRTVLSQDHQNLQALSLLAFDAFQRQAYQEAIGAWQVMKQLMPAGDSRQLMLDRSIAKAQAELGIVPQPLQTITIEAAKQINLKQYPNLIVAVYSPGVAVPVAVKQLTVSSMPQTVQLADGDSMMPDRQLSSLKEVVVKVRLDNDRDIMSKSGNWFAESKPIPLGEAITLKIDQQYD